ncbi:MAG: SPOR domain-containing protein [Magnetococcales bacterium]|nr:SPOR domain-containing protein [Magnetococcales bacterium]
MKTRMSGMGRGIGVAVGCWLGLGIAVPSLADTIYYPGYLAYYPYGDGSFVYTLPHPETAPETHVVPLRPPQVVEAPAGLPVPSMASFSPNQAEVSRVMLAGYSVHVGSFLKSADAEELEDRLQQLNLPFFLAPAVINGTSYTQLHVGPFHAQDQAFVASDTIRDSLGLQGVVLSHGPQQTSSGH